LGRRITGIKPVGSSRFCVEFCARDAMGKERRGRRCISAIVVLSMLSLLKIPG
jgi:hypothetical protein